MFQRRKRRGAYELANIVARHFKVLERSKKGILFKLNLQILKIHVNLRIVCIECKIKKNLYSIDNNPTKTAQKCLL